MRIQIRLMKNIKGIARSKEPKPENGLLLGQGDNQMQSPSEEVGSEFEDLGLKNLPADGVPQSPLPGSPSIVSPSLVSLLSVPLDDLALEEAHSIRNFLRTLQEHQNELDRARDTSDIRQLLTSALSSGTNQEMIRVLQMGKHDMLHAIRYFLEAWETRPLCSHPRASSSRVPRDQALPQVRSLTWPLDKQQDNRLDRSYLDPDILRGPMDVETPSWTINKCVRWLLIRPG